MKQQFEDFFNKSVFVHSSNEEATSTIIIQSMEKHCTLSIKVDCSVNTIAIARQKALQIFISQLPFTATAINLVDGSILYGSKCFWALVGGNATSYYFSDFCPDFPDFLKKVVLPPHKAAHTTLSIQTLDGATFDAYIYGEAINLFDKFDVALINIKAHSSHSRCECRQSS